MTPSPPQLVGRYRTPRLVPVAGLPRRAPMRLNRRPPRPRSRPRSSY